MSSWETFSSISTPSNTGGNSQKGSIPNNNMDDSTMDQTEWSQTLSGVSHHKKRGSSGHYKHKHSDGSKHTPKAPNSSKHADGSKHTPKAPDSSKNADGSKHTPKVPDGSKHTPKHSGHKSSNHTSKSPDMKTSFFSRNGCKLFVRIQGDTHPERPSIIFIHPIGLNSAVWTKHQKYFSRYVKTVSYDLRGHGQSDSSDPNFSNHSDDLAFLIQELKLANYIIVSWGTGSLVNLRYLSKNATGALSVLGSVLINPNINNHLYWSAEAKEKTLSLLEHNFSKYTHDSSSIITSDNNDVRQFVGKLLSENGKDKTIRQLNELFAYTVYDFQPRTINVPVLIVFGGQDKATPPLSSLQLRSEIKSARILELPNAPHALPLTDFHPCVDIIRDFARGIYHPGKPVH